jgi:hypothetical protein
MIRIGPKQYISEKFIQDYYGYTKSEAMKLYRDKFPQFSRNELKFYA